MSYSLLKFGKLIGIRQIANGWPLLAILMANLASSPVLLAAELNPPQDGWVSWKISVVKNAPNWCCYDWRGEQAVKKVCNLDSRHINYGGSRYDNRRVIDNAIDDMQIYAFMKDGQPEKIRALSSSCPVKTKTAITDIGPVNINDSVDWLASYISPQSDISGHALAAVAVHAGNKSRNILVDTAQTDSNTQNRMDAVFWMGQIRALDTEKEIKQIMFGDENSKVRQHAAFSLSQSVIPGRAESLVRLGNSDPNDNVRSQAWFWLAQTKAEQSETAIFKALQTEGSREVQEQAVFALSQLPEKRAVNALVTIIENQELPRRLRKNALFWMAQNESIQAFEYLEKMLAIN